MLFELIKAFWNLLELHKKKRILETKLTCCLAFSEIILEAKLYSKKSGHGKLCLSICFSFLLNKTACNTRAETWAKKVFYFLLCTHSTSKMDIKGILSTAQKNSFQEIINVCQLLQLGRQLWQNEGGKMNTFMKFSVLSQRGDWRWNPQP